MHIIENLVQLDGFDTNKNKEDQADREYRKSSLHQKD